MDSDKPPEKPAYVKRLAPDAERRLYEGSRKPKSKQSQLLIDPGIGFRMMTLVGDWKPIKPDDAPNYRAKVSSYSRAYLLCGSDAIVSNLGRGHPFNDGDFIELTRKLGPIDPSSPNFQRLKTTVFKDIQIEKAESHRLGGGVGVSVLGYYKGKRVLSIIINERLDELSFEASPAEFEKHLPLFQKSLDTIWCKQHLLYINTDLWKQKQLQKNSMKSKD